MNNYEQQDVCTQTDFEDNIIDHEHEVPQIIIDGDADEKNSVIQNVSFIHNDSSE